MKFCLNSGIPENYAFFDPESTLHVTRDHPVDSTDRVTSGIQRGLSTKRIIEVTENEPKKEAVVVKEKAPVVTETVAEPIVVETAAESVAEDPESKDEAEVVETETKKKGRKKASDENE